MWYNINVKSLGKEMSRLFLYKKIFRRTYLSSLFLFQEVNYVNEDMWQVWKENRNK